MFFRKMNFDDIKSVSNIYLESFGVCTDKINYTKDNIYVVGKDSVIMGMCMIDCIDHVFSGDKVFYINDICVSINYRRKGVASFMLSEIVKLAQEEKVTSIMLTSNKDRCSAISLYEKFGFEKYDTNVMKKISF